MDQNLTDGPFKSSLRSIVWFIGLQTPSLLSCYPWKLTRLSRKLSELQLLEVSFISVRSPFLVFLSFAIISLGLFHYSLSSSLWPETPHRLS